MRAFAPAIVVQRTIQQALRRDRIQPVAAGSALGLAFLALTIYFYMALSWARLPFLGFRTGPQLIIESLAWHEGRPWGSARSPTSVPRQIARLDGLDIADAADLWHFLAGARPGQVLQLTTRPMGGGQETTAAVRLSSFPLSEFAPGFVVPYSAGLLVLAVGVWVFVSRPKQIAGQLCAVLAAAMAVTLAGLFDLQTSVRLTPVWAAALGPLGGSLLALVGCIPQVLPAFERAWAAPWAITATGLGIGVAAGLSMATSAEPLAYVYGLRSAGLLIALSYLAFVAMLLVRMLTSPSPVARELSRLPLLGGILAAAPLMTWLLVRPFLPGIGFNPAWLTPSLALLPMAIAYGLLRRRAPQVDLLLSRSLLYSLLGGLIVLSYVLLVAGISLIGGAALGPAEPAIVGAFIFVLAIAFEPLRRWLQRLLDAAFFRGAKAYQTRLQAFANQLTRDVDLKAIAERVRAEIEDTVSPAPLHIFLFDPISQSYAAAPIDDSPTTDLRFHLDSGLVRLFSSGGPSLHLVPGQTLPATVIQEKARLAVLGCVLLVAIPGVGRPAGWLALGPRKSGLAYGKEDLAFLETLAYQSSLAVARAQVVVDLERRIRELDVLTRVAQAVNFTQTYDDLLELIYTQTNHIIPTSELRIAIHDDATGILRYAFYLTRSERKFEQEGVALQRTSGLLPVVYQSGMPMVEEDYREACLERGAKVDAPYHAWMGVPLNAATHAFGAIGLGMPDAGQRFTEAQLKIFLAIADQAAGAILKAGLLQETEERARQLATLNQVAGRLGATLEVEPLLEQMLESSIDLLDCAAGRLVLIDEATGEGVVHAAIGMPATRPRLDRVEVGDEPLTLCLRLGEPQLINQPAIRQAPGDPALQRIGAEVTGLLAVPLVFKDRVLGAIEVLNKRNGRGFSLHDQTLLSAFAFQASVAIENARLYTLTDRALSARVEELSVLQRIDRELSATLDLDRSASIALGWALHSTGANAGLIAIARADALQLRISQGYPRGQEPSPGEALTSLLGPAEERPAEERGTSGEAPPPALGFLSLTLQKGSPAWVDDILAEAAPRGLHPEARSLAVVPLLGHGRSLGVMLLESLEPNWFDSERQGFLTRLADHASIAIHNAQLYEELRGSNQAKTEFISFAGHELKTPMTSIKGYADLLAKGNAGPITELQANFLATIRSNVDRMASLVSDLSDISRVEAGQLKLEFRSVPFSEVVEDVVRSSREQADTSGLSLDVSLPEPLPPAWGDRVRLVQILTNLISNAIKYTPSGGRISISVSASDNLWDVDGALRVLQTTVADTGIGIAPGDQPRIFETFFRSDDEAVREMSGTGLGLSIARHLVELQGGRIWFESKQDEGTTFHFTIPVREEVTEVAPTSAIETMVAKRRRAPKSVR